MKSIRRTFLKGLIGGGAVVSAAALPEQLMAFGRCRSSRAACVQPSRDLVDSKFYVGFPLQYVSPLQIYGGPTADNNGMFYTWGTYAAGAPLLTVVELVRAATRPTQVIGSHCSGNLSGGDTNYWAFLLTGVAYDGTQFQLRFNRNNTWIAGAVCAMNQAKDS